MSSLLFESLWIRFGTEKWLLDGRASTGELQTSHMSSFRLIDVEPVGDWRSDRPATLTITIHLACRRERYSEVD